MALRFLPPKDVSEALVGLFKEAKEAKLAVSFWGRTAIQQLGLRREGLKCRVVLNLLSGAVDPFVVDALGFDKVRSERTLHSKVYWTDVGAIVGSCNASMNGLGFTWGEINGRSMEAAVWIAPETSAWREIRAFCDSLFEKSLEIDQTMMEQASELWRRRREQRFGPPAETRPSLANEIAGSSDGLRERRLYLLIEHYDGKVDPPTPDEKTRANELGINLHGFDRWDEHVPIGMRALCYDRGIQGAYRLNYLSEVSNSEGAHFGRGKHAITIAQWTEDYTIFERDVGISVSQQNDVPLLKPILDYIWDDLRNSKWNIYRKRNETFACVLVKIEDVIAELPATIRSSFL